MDCPTCFQKITVPQAPSGEEQKLIITGSKVSDKPAFVPGMGSGAAVAPDKNFPGILAVLIILLFIGTAAGAICWLTIIRPRLSAQHNGGEGAPATNMVANKPRPSKPALVAPPASDTNWTLALDPGPIPDSPVAGRILAQDFIAERATFQNGTLSLRTGPKAPMEMAATINFSGAQPDEMSGKIISVGTNVDKAAEVTLRWKDENGKVHKKNFEAGYAMRLEFGTFAKNRLPGKIYLCTPDDEKSYLIGAFRATVPKPKAPKAQ